MKKATLKFAVVSMLMSAVLGLCLAPATAQDRFPGDYLMVVDPATDRLVVKINDTTLTFAGDPQSSFGRKTSRVHIEPYMKPGDNRVTITYGRLGRTPGFVRVSYARDPGRYRTVFNYEFKRILPPPNNRTFTFVAEGPRGSGRVSTGSASRQTVLNYSADRTTLELWVNGQYLGRHTSSGLRDISNYWRRGARNSVRVKWDGLPNFDVSCAYAQNKNRFKSFWSYALHTYGAKRGDKTFTVLAPLR